MNNLVLKNTMCTHVLLGVVAMNLFWVTQVFAIPPRPEAIEFEKLEFTPPRANDFRRMLSDGTVVYVAESHEFPLVKLSVTFKGGDSLDPEGAPGLASVMARMVREGGAGDMNPGMFDETLDFLATEVSVSAGNTFTTARMNSLSDNFDESLKLFVTMLRKPAFDKQRLEVAKARLLESLKQRNDNASSILAREWKAMLYGRTHFEASQPTALSVEAINREQLQTIHDKILHPGNMIVAVSGDFAIEEMLEKLSKAFSGWERGAVAANPKTPKAVLVPGLYHVQKDIPQGKVVLGKRGIVRDDPDAIPLLLLNEILGAGGFTSRLMQKVRSNEGLAYSVRSILSQRVDYPGAFQATFESKNPTVALAAKIVFGEIALIRDQPVSDAEIEVAKQGLIETFPRQFESKPATLQIFVNDEWTNRPKDYWRTFREKVSSVTKEDLLRVAKKHLDPSQMAILVVGDWEAIARGDLEGRATMQDFFGGEVKHLPLRDPLTLEPLPLD
ncbi:insulinase family protein [Pirellulales bacterium]|jgi:zinc protease|nr:insulinase family protein [Pirellulales bacterium]